jgi:acyl-CoA synthetase (AMP-forming)/AMP-acid ligase II
MSADGHLLDRLRRHATRTPERPALCFLDRGENERHAWSYAGLDRRARGIADTLTSLDARGRTVLLDYEPGLEFVAAFFGALYAGAIAVPISSTSASRSRERLASVAGDAHPHLVLSTSAQRDGLRAAATGIPALARAQWVATDALGDLAESAADLPQIGAESVAFLQYTSGSTSAPRGVVVTHGNLVANLEMMRDAFGHDADTCTVNWLPHFHDMGLISGILLSVFVGGRAVLMAPTSFIQKPIRWLRAIERYGARFSGGPNFAYEQCCQRIDASALASLDLDNWQVAFCGAEPVRSNTLNAFARIFAAARFDARSLLPCYGLAEATLYVAGSPRRRGVLVRADTSGGTRTGLERVSCGVAASGSSVVIADPASRRPLQEGEIGEIHVAGPHVAAGYWNQPSASAETFHETRSESSDSAIRWLRTGDLGTIVEGELYITGRIKDAFKVRGSMQHPEDIETVALESHAALKGATAAVFEMDDGQREAVYVLTEVARRRGVPGPERERELAMAARAAYGSICQIFGFAPQVVVVVEARSLPRTSSGKIRRSAARDAYVSGSLPVLVTFRAGDK